MQYVSFPASAKYLDLLFEKTYSPSKVSLSTMFKFRTSFSVLVSHRKSSKFLSVDIEEESIHIINFVPHTFILCTSNLWATSSLIFTIKLLTFIFHMEIETQQITIIVQLFFLMWIEELRTSIFNYTDGWNIPSSEESSSSTISSWILPPHKECLGHCIEWCGRQPEETIYELIGLNNSNSSILVSNLQNLFSSRLNSIDTTAVDTTRQVIFQLPISCRN